VLDRDHRLVDDLADLRRLRLRGDLRPARVGGNPEDILSGAFVPILGIGVRLLRELRVLFLERVGNALQKD